MNDKTGLWIDRRKAVFVHLSGDQVRTETLLSNLERHTRLAGGSRSKVPYGPQDVAHEGHFERKYQQHVDAFLEKVCSRLEDASSIYITGPGDAKLQLRHHLEAHPHLLDRLRAIEPADKMSEAQFAARVRKFFTPPTPIHPAPAHHSP